MPHRPDGILHLPILHHTFVPILKGEGGKRGREGRGLGLLGSAMAVQLEPEAVELLLSWMLGSCEPLKGSYHAFRERWGLCLVGVVLSPFCKSLVASRTSHKLHRAPNFLTSLPASLSKE